MITKRDDILSAIKAYMSHGLIYSIEQQQWRTGRLQSKKTRVKTDMLRSIGKQSGESVSGRRKGRLRWEGFAEKESFKPGMEE